MLFTITQTYSAAMQELIKSERLFLILILVDFLLIYVEIFVSCFRGACLFKCFDNLIVNHFFSSFYL